MNTNIETKMGKLVEKLDDYRPDAVAEIQSMQASLKQAMLKQNLAEHPALQLMLDTLKKREASYTMVISNKEDLDPLKRAAYFARRGEVRFVLSFFDVDSTIETIERQIETELDQQLSEDVAVDVVAAP